MKGLPEMEQQLRKLKEHSKTTTAAQQKRKELQRKRKAAIKVRQKTEREARANKARQKDRFYYELSEWIDKVILQERTKQ